MADAWSDFVKANAAKGPEWWHEHYSAELAKRHGLTVREWGHYERAAPQSHLAVRPAAENERKRTRTDRINRLRGRIDTIGWTEPQARKVLDVMKGILDLLADEL